MIYPDRIFHIFGASERLRRGGVTAYGIKVPKNPKNAISELTTWRVAKPFRGRKDITKMFVTTYNDRGKSITQFEKSRFSDFRGVSYAVPLPAYECITD